MKAWYLILICLIISVICAEETVIIDISQDFGMPSISDCVVPVSAKHIISENGSVITSVHYLHPKNTNIAITSRYKIDAGMVEIFRKLFGHIFSDGLIVGDPNVVDGPTTKVSLHKDGEISTGTICSTMDFINGSTRPLSRSLIAWNLLCDEYLHKPNYTPMKISYEIMGIKEAMNKNNTEYAFYKDAKISWANDVWKIIEKRNVDMSKRILELEDKYKKAVGEMIEIQDSKVAPRPSFRPSPSTQAKPVGIESKSE